MVEKAESDHSETKKKLDDQSMEHKIAAKRQVRMIKDLKSHLKKEAKSKTLLEEKLKSTTGVLARLQEEMATAVPVVVKKEQPPQLEQPSDGSANKAVRRASGFTAMLSQTISGASISSSPDAKPKSTETSTTPSSKEYS